jgi:hypothetical protein
MWPSGPSPGSCPSGAPPLFVLVVLAHHRPRIVHFNVIERPTGDWTAQQIVDAFTDDTAPAYLLRDRDRVHGHPFGQPLKNMRIGEVVPAATAGVTTAVQACAASAAWADIYANG